MPIFMGEILDISPDPFVFVDVVDAELSTQYTSNSIIVSGIDKAVPAIITGGEMSINGGPFTTSSGMVSNGDTVQVRVTSSPSFTTEVSVTLSIIDQSDTYNVTTKEAVPILLNTQLDATGSVYAMHDSTNQIYCGMRYSTGGTPVSFTSFDYYYAGRNNNIDALNYVVRIYPLIGNDLDLGNLLGESSSISGSSMVLYNYHTFSFAAPIFVSSGDVGIVVVETVNGSGSAFIMGGTHSSNPDSNFYYNTWKSTGVTHWAPGYQMRSNVYGYYG